MLSITGECEKKPGAQASNPIDNVVLCFHKKTKKTNDNVSNDNASKVIKGCLLY